MSGQVSSTLQPLADAVDDRDLRVDNAVLTEAFALADRLNAKLLAAVGRRRHLDDRLAASPHPAAPQLPAGYTGFR